MLVGLAGIAAVRISVGAFAEAAEEQAEETAPLKRLGGLIHTGENAASHAFFGSGEPAAFDRIAGPITAELRRLRTVVEGPDEQRSLSLASAAWDEAREELAGQLARPLRQRVTHNDALIRFDELAHETETAIEATELAADAEAAAKLQHAKNTQNRAQLVMLLLMLLGLTTALLVGRRLASAVLEPVRQLEEGARRIGAGEFSHRIGNGRDDELGALAAAFDSMAGDIERAQTALRESQERLLQTQKLEAVGQLAGGIAHDFNNLLLVVGSYADFLHESFEEDDPRRDDAAQIRQASDRAAALTRQLLTFSRRDVTQPVPLDAAAAIARLEEMLRRTLTATIDLRLELEPDLRATVIDPGQLEQAVHNLVLNARNAMPDGGTLTIRANAVAVDESRPVNGVAPGAYIAVAVSDTGQGMSEEVRSRALEPFFTTRADAGGSGLGLATVYGIVTGAGGAMTIESSPGEGTTVALYLSTTSESVEAPAAAEPTRRCEREDHTVVLLAEDEPTIRELTTRILSGQGYIVLAAASGIEALKLARGTERIDVLLTDVIMPGMTGGELAATLAEERPGLTTVYMSGYSDQIVAQHGVLDANTLYLQKPFRPQELLELLAGALAYSA